MSIVRALRCDWQGCNQIASEEIAKRDGWLTVGGNRRGRYRGDLCTLHVRHLMHQAQRVTGKGKKR